MNRKNQQSGNRSSKTAPDISNTSERLALDLEQATQLAKVLDTELGVDGLRDVQEKAQQVIEQQQQSNNNNDDGEINKKEEDEDENEQNENNNNNKNKDDWKIKKKLDMILVYLRNVHMYCYYCGLECDSSEELNRKCIDPHHRKLPASTSTDAKQNSKNERICKFYKTVIIINCYLYINDSNHFIYLFIYLCSTTMVKKFRSTYSFEN